jgi:uncharacterized protein HemX
MDTQNQQPVTQQQAEPVISAPTPPSQAPMPEHHGHGKKVFAIVFIIALFILGLSVFSLYLSNKNQMSDQAEQLKQQANTQPEVSPTSVPSPTPADDESALESLDTGNPDSDLQDLQKDVNQL